MWTLSSSSSSSIALRRHGVLLLLLFLCLALHVQAFVPRLSHPNNNHHQRTRSSSLVTMDDAKSGSSGETKKSRWPMGRALKTFLKFNAPRIFSGRRSSSKKGAVPASSVAAQIGADLPLGHGVVLVTGATGGVGKRVVSLLLEKGLRVRALARNKQKALAMLSDGKDPAPDSRLELVTADIRDPASLTPEMFEGVVAIMSCTSAIVQVNNKE